MVGVDPFWRPREILAVLTTQLAAPAPGTHGQLQSVSALFTVSPSALDAIKDKKTQARLVCVQPEDGPPNRCHWYGGSYVLLNHQPFEVTKEDRVQLVLGANQADQAADLSSGLQRGANRLTYLWPLGIAGAVAVLRLCEPLAPSDLLHRLAPPLPLREAVELVRAHMAMGPSGQDEEDGDEEEQDKGKNKVQQGGEGKDAEALDEEDEQAVQEEPSTQEGSGEYPGAEEPRRSISTAAKAAGAGRAAGGTGEQQRRRSRGASDGRGSDGTEALDSGLISVSLRCPLTGGLVSSPAHFGTEAALNPLAFFEVAAFLELAERTGSWVCPATARLGGLQDLRPHAFLTAVLGTLDHNGVRQRVEAIDVAPCGSWRPKDSRVPFLPLLELPKAEGQADGGAGAASGGEGGWVPPRFDPRLLNPEEGGEDGRDVVDLTDE